MGKASDGTGSQDSENEEKREEEKPLLLISDTNFVIQAYIFADGDELLNASTSLGEVAIPVETINELQRWVNNPSGKKCQKFGQGHLRRILSSVKKRTGNIGEVPSAALSGQLSVLSIVERNLASKQAGSATSREDKMLILSAKVNKANLATHDKRMRELAVKVLPSESKVVSLGDLIVEAFDAGSLNLKSLENGKANMRKYDENLMSRDEVTIDTLLAENSSYAEENE